MQQTLLKQWQDLTQYSVAFYKGNSESQAAAINNLIKMQWDSANWAGFAKSSLDSFNALSKINESTLNSLWQTQLASSDLNGLAAALRELNEINASTVTTLVQNQINVVSLFMEAAAKHLESLKQAQGIEEIIAAQAHLFTEIQEKLKTNSLETLQTLGSVRAALTAWAEKAIDNAAASEEITTSAVSSKRQRAAST